MTEEKGHPCGGGNKNAIAYGLLQEAGYNTNGMSPSEAWELVTALNLMESRWWKRTDEYEYWAECFTMYKINKERLPEKNMVEGVLDNYVKTQSRRG